MPPALSDNEDSQSEEESIPFKKDAKKSRVEEKEEEDDDDDKNGEDDNGEEEDDGDEDEDEEVFVVEKIMNHDYTKEGVLIFEVKWQGYEKKSDRTWEPEDNLSGAQEMLNKYFDSIGGRPDPVEASSGKKGKGKRKSAAIEDADEPKQAKRGRKKRDSENGTPGANGRETNSELPWVPRGSWENDVLRVETVAEQVEKESGKPVRVVFLLWNNGKKTQHTVQTVYTKCPQRMLQFYEQHLVFTKQADASEYDGERVIPQTNGDADTD